MYIKYTYKICQAFQYSIKKLQRNPINKRKKIINIKNKTLLLLI